MAQLIVFDHLTWAIATLTLFTASCVAYILIQRYCSSLRSIPGPFLAAFTDLWRFLKVYEGRFERALQAEHDKHGDLVRAGPNCVSIGDPREIRQIYGISRLFQKVSHLA
jgi:hypothetical protein